METQAGGWAGIVLWGNHRDSAELNQIGSPVFSYGSYLAGSIRLDTHEATALASACFGSVEVTNEDAIFADDDGVLFVRETLIDDVLEAGRSIWERERKQANAVQNVTMLREQFRLAEYVSKKASDPDYTFRKHLQVIGGVIEE